MELSETSRRARSGSSPMRVLNIVHDSIVDGPGLRTVIFFAGCPHHCRGCHNPESWNPKGGIEMTIDEIAAECLSNPLNDVTFSGGDPLYQVEELAALAVILKANQKNIWCYTGYTYEDLQEKKDPSISLLFQHIDALVDGPFVLAKRDLSLLYRGSSNQRIFFF